MYNKPRELSKHALEQSCVSPLCCKSHLIQMRSSWWILYNIGHKNTYFRFKTTPNQSRCQKPTLLNLINTCGRAWNQHAHQVTNLQPNNCKLLLATISLASLLVPRKFLRTSYIVAQKVHTQKPDDFSWSKNAMTAATQVCPLHPHTQTYKRGSEVRIQKIVPTQHSTNKSCASLATRTSGGNISLMILVIVAAWEYQSS